MAKQFDRYAGLHRIPDGLICAKDRVIDTTQGMVMRCFAWI